MNEEEIRELLEEKGYTLDKIVHFKKTDRIRWHSPRIHVAINLRCKIESLSKKSLERWIL